MTRKHAGKLVEKSEGFFARIWIARAGGRYRKVIDLGTRDAATARRKMDEVVAELQKGALVSGR